MKYGKFEGVFLNDNQDLQLKVSIANNDQTNINGGSLLGGGLRASYKEAGDDAANNFIPIKSVILRKNIDDMKEEDQVKPQYLYSRFNCEFPLPIGKSCDLELAMSGNHDNKKHQGHLYISDAASKIRSIPVYRNYHLLSEPKEVVVNQSGIAYPSTFTLQMQNASSDNYVKIEISGLPDGVKIKQNSDGSKDCTQGIKAGTSCTISYDVSKIAKDIIGSFDITITGLTANLLPVYQSIPKVARNKVKKLTKDIKVAKSGTNNNYQKDKHDKMYDEFINDNSSDTEKLVLEIKPEF